MITTKLSCDQRSLTTNPTSVLDAGYIEPTRPYSQKELLHLRDRTYRSLRLGTSRAEHQQCGHFYYVKENGRKEKQIKEEGQNDIGNCSVCWRMKQTPINLKGRAKDLVHEYNHIYGGDPGYLNHYIVSVENTFYRWLYYG